MVVGGEIIQENTNLGEDTEGRDEVIKKETLERGYTPDKETHNLNNNLKLVVLLQIIIVIFLILNIALLQIGFFSKDAIIYPGDGIDLSIESVGDSSIEYTVGLSLKNTGDRTAKVSVTGEVYISEMGSATGDEMTTILKYKYIEISPDRTRNFDLGTFTAYEGWHYVVKVHISWNGGSLELSEMQIPTP